VQSYQIVFSLTTFLCYVVVYRPMLRRLDEDIKSTRALLAMLPNDVVNAIDEIKCGINELIKQHMGMR
jgi:hypothetical protein